MQRRGGLKFEVLAAAPGLIGSLASGLSGRDEGTSEYQNGVRQYLTLLIRTKQEVSDWLAGRAFPFAKYDPELGYLHRNRRFRQGMEDSICAYTYDPNGARHTIMHADKPCRINSYGNSFTSCEQVSDGESYQEVLAAFLGEPIRNYGVGGYSVYQAYLRMKREEKLYPAPYVIFNIFDDDHYRNLISWQEIANGKNWQHFQPPMPYVIANPATGQFEETPNPCPTPDSLYNLCNLDWVYKRFKDDFVLKLRLAQEAGKHQHANPALGQMVQTLAAQQGMHTRVNYSGADLIKTADSMYTRAAIFTSTRIVDQIEEFAAANNKKILYVLSYGPANVAKRLLAEKRFDHTFVDFMKTRNLIYVDLLEAHAADYAQFKPDIEDYLARYYVGHYNPRGDFFCASTMLDKLVSMLDPKPAPYAGAYDCNSGTCHA
jgi:hypothetical protein